MRRREFVKLCAASAAAAAPAAWTPAADAAMRRYARCKLVDAHGAPLRAASLPVNRNLIFQYPYAATPCFLLDLGKPTASSARLATADRHTYEWSGGVGPRRSIVAYSAICAHQLAYPTPEISFIAYRNEPSAGTRYTHVIHCCSEHSQYDPAAGARVLGGPAKQPLAAIVLEHVPATDELYAVGTLGGEMFNRFFAKYAFRLKMERGRAAHDAVRDRCTVRPLEDYCRQLVQC